MPLSFNFDIGKMRRRKVQRELIQAFAEKNPELIESLGLDSSNISNVAPNDLVNLMQVQNLGTKSDEAKAMLDYYNSRNLKPQNLTLGGNTVSPVRPYSPPAISPVQPISGGAEQAFEQYRSGLLDPLSAGGVQSPAPQNLLEYQAKQAIDANVDINKQRIKDISKSTKESQTAIGTQSQFVKEFGDSYNEVVDTVPEVGKVGIAGKVYRLEASVREKLDQFPKSSAFLKRQKVLANKQARLIEGGRVTDQDRQVYADAMANVFNSPTTENVYLAAGSIMDIYNAPLDDSGKKANVKPLLKDLSSADNPVLNQIVKEVLRRIPADERRSLLNVSQ